MYRFRRVAKVTRGKQREAMQWSKEIAEHVSASHPTGTVQAHSQIFGDVGTIHWFADYEDMAAYEAHNAQMMGDQEYWAMIDKGNELFVEGSVHDTLTRAL